MSKHYWLMVMSVLVVSGCVSPSHFQWGDYEQNLYDYYHEPGIKEKVIQNHLKMVAAQVEAGKKIAPGMYAEAGTFYLEKGDKASAVKYYKLEKQAWPDSAKLMDQLISTLEKEEKGDFK